jgi:hypothetical protein
MAQRRTFSEVNKRIADLTIQLNKLLAEYKKLEAEGKSSSEINEKLGRSIESLSKKLSTLSNVTSQYNKQQRTTSQQRKETNAALEDAVKAHNRLTDSINKTRISEEKAAKANKTFGEGLSSVFSPASIGRSIGTITKFVGIYNLLQKSVDAVRAVTIGSIEAFIDFEAALARVRAVAGTTSEETNRLEKAIRNTAGTTVFTLGEVASLTEELVKLGFSADQAAESILPVAQTAQALGESANDVALLLGTISKEFGLTTAEISNTGDILVGAINRSALSFDSFRTAIQYIGPLARQNGTTLSETAAAMALLANAGFSASRIGTGLRQVFIKLGQSGESVIDQLEELSKRGVSLGEALEITDVRTAAAVSTLALAAPLIREMADDFERQGRAALASAVQTSTFSGQVKILKSAFDDLQVSLGAVIADSNFLINLIGLFSRTAEKAAMSAKLISSEGFNFDKYIESVKQASNELNSLDRGYNKAFESAKKLVEGVTGEYWFNNRKEVIALTESILKAAETQDKFRKSNEASERFLNEYRDQVKNNVIGIEDLTLKLAILNNELQSGNLLTDAQRLLKEAEKKAIEELVLELGRERDARAALAKEQKAAREKLGKEEVEEIKKRKARIREEIRVIKDQRQTELKALEDRAKLQGEAAKTTEERAAIELKLNQDITDLNEKTNNRLEYQFGQFVKLSDDAANVIKKYGTEFPSVVNDLSELVNELNGDFFALSDSIKMSLSDVANDAINDAKSVLSTYQKQLDELNEKFGENAGKTEEYFVALEGITTNLGAEILGIADAIDRTTEEGEAAYQIILQLLTKVENAAKRPSKKNSEFDWSKFWNEVLVDSLRDAIDLAQDALKRFNDVAFENTKNRLDAQKAAIRGSADIENDILKSQLENQLITEEEFRNRSERNRKRAIAKENAIDKAIFDAEQKRDKQSALTDYLVALASIVPNLIVKDKEANPVALAIKAAITGGLATASYASEVSAINQRQFFPKRFAEGGIVNGPSHAQGGVPFTVQGQGGYEMEGGEFIVNKRAASLHRSLLERINGSIKPSAMSGSRVYDNPGSSIRKFASGGSVSAEQAERSSQLQLEYLRAIAESNVSVAEAVSKPVRAFVTQTDLRNSELERRIINKNSRL